MYIATRDYGRKGSIMAAISAIDIALWDIAGHFYSQPIHPLLGGAFRYSIKPYAAGFYRVEGLGEAARLAKEARHHHQAGFTSMKIKLGFGLADDLAVMRAIGDAFEHTDVELMVDVNHAYGRQEARALGEALSEYLIRWYEEPLVPEDITGYAELRKLLTVAIAGSENEHSSFGFNQLFFH